MMISLWKTWWKVNVKMQIIEDTADWFLTFISVQELPENAPRFIILSYEVGDDFFVFIFIFGRLQAVGANKLCSLRSKFH